MIGRQHAERLVSGTANTRLVALADNIPHAATAAGAEFGVPAGKVTDMLERDDVDAVVIAVPSGLHAARTGAPVSPS